MDDNPEIIDLNELIPPNCTIHFEESDISVKPPTTASILILNDLGQRLNFVSDLSTTEVEQLVAKTTTEVKKCIPELADVELNSIQLFKLVQLLNDMAKPRQAEELKKRGIEPNIKKKAE